MKDIIKFINENITYIAILICLLAIWLIYVDYSKENEYEHMINNISSEIFHETIFKQNKKINFRCTIDGVNYYLAQIPVNSCEKQLDLECINSMIVLVPEKNMEVDLERYNRMLKSNVEICNMSRTIKCKNGLVQPRQGENEECEKEWEQCKIERNYIHDYMLEEVTKKDDKTRKYLFKGTSIPNLENSMDLTMLNQHLVYENGSSVMCGDSYLYGNGKTNDEHAEVIVSERITGKTGIIGAIPPIKVKLMFNTQAVIVGKDPNTGSPKYIRYPDKKAFTYIGLCKSTPTETFTCKHGSFEYKRICLVSESEKFTNENLVLEFDPIVVM